jgi:hypothetical protein
VDDPDSAAPTGLTRHNVHSSFRVIGPETCPVFVRTGITFSVQASEEMRAAAATYRARGAPGDAEVADRLEEAARNAAMRESVWQLAEYSTQEQTQLSEFWWRNELAIAPALHPPAQ